MRARRLAHNIATLSISVIHCARLYTVYTYITLCMYMYSLHPRKNDLETRLNGRALTHAHMRALSAKQWERAFYKVEGWLEYVVLPHIYNCRLSEFALHNYGFISVWVMTVLIITVSKITVLILYNVP